jgi:hypothetical protein
MARNARVLSPVNYEGNSTATGNWRSTNASITFNNANSCGCSVNGADWQVSAATSWTPTRNFGLIFRVPNGYSLRMAVAHSMRIFLLENTAAAGNYVCFEGVILSQGPVTADQRLARLRDQQNPTVYASLGISQHLNQDAANTFVGTVALAAGSATVTFPTAYNSAPVCTVRAIHRPLLRCACRRLPLRGHYRKRAARIRLRTFALAIPISAAAACF